MNEETAMFSKKKLINEKTINFLLILILGFLVGVAVKTEAKKRVTIGFGDYLVSSMKQDFDLLKPESAPPAETQQEAPAPAPSPEEIQNGSAETPGQ